MPSCNRNSFGFILRIKLYARYRVERWRSTFFVFRWLAPFNSFAYFCIVLLLSATIVLVAIIGGMDNVLN